MSRVSSTTALLAVCGLAAIPWVFIQNAGSDLTFVMSWGLLNTNPWHILGLSGYLGATQGLDALPWSLQVWPFGLAFYVGAVVSAASGVLFEREDPRITAGLLVLSAVGSLFVWQGLVGRGVSGAIPVGAVSTGIVVWWFYWPAIRELGMGGRPPT